MEFQRSAGLLLHPTSLPGRFGIGELGPEAYELIDFISESGMSLWQVLPLGPTGYADSPYQCLSAFAGNTLLISTQQLVADGFLSAEELEPMPDFPDAKVDFGAVIPYKKRLLNLAYQRFASMHGNEWTREFQAFTHRNEKWLDGWALYKVLKESHDGAAWYFWDREYALREPDALRQFGKDHAEEIRAEKFFQFLFDKAWDALHVHCGKSGVQIVGDVPIFVAHDSADVWMNPHLFKLDKHGVPLVVAGVPPDYFSSTGQLWGNPLYDWDRMREDGFEWWLDRVHSVFDHFDVMRIDHFRGFAACWEIPNGETTAENGQWVKVPGHEFFEAVKKKFPGMPIIVEDLGVITPDVIELRDRFNFPGMRILQMAFAGDSSNVDLPHNYVQHTVAYTGTHDNDTAVGWFNSKPGRGSTRDTGQILQERHHCMEYLGTTGEQINWDFIRTVYSSVARIAVVPLQDVLGLGSEARMNLPASQGNNWKWRYKQHVLDGELSQRLLELGKLYGRVR